MVIMGTPDTSTGIVVSLAEQLDGKILALAQNRNSIPVLTRWLPDGSPDLSFGTEGTVLLSATQATVRDAMAVYSDGRILVMVHRVFPGLVRLLPDGSPDPSFGSGGTMTFSTHDLAATVDSVAVLDDGKILAAGSFPDASVDSRRRTARLFRLLPDGSPDPSFGPGGIFTFPFLDSNALDLAVLPDGKVLVTGSWSQSGVNHLWLGNLAANGAPDPLFGTDGMVFVAPNPYGLTPSKIAVQPDGAIIVTANLQAPTQGMRLFRFKADGTLDSGFQGGLGVRESPAGGAAHFTSGLAVQADGKLLMAGTADGEFAIFRYLANGTRDAGFGDAGVVKIQVPDLICQGHSMMLLANGRILAGGMARSLSALDRSMLVRCVTHDFPAALAAEWPPGTALTNGGAPISASVVKGDPAIPEITFTITLRNISSHPLTDAVAVLRGPDAEHFELLSALPPELPAGGTATLTLRFNPAAQAAVLTAALVIESADPDAPYFVIPLRCITEAPVAAMALMQNGASLPHDSTLSFGPALPSVPVTRILTIQSTGNIPLQVLGVSLAATGHPADFTPGLPDMEPVAPNASTTLPVTFTPGGPGIRTARLRIASTDTFNPPYEINLTGALATGMDAWRLTHFATAANTGPASDLNDPDHDGIPNLLEFATFTDPLSPGPLSGDISLRNDTLEYTFTRPAGAAAILNYSLERATAPQGPWIFIGGSLSIPGSDAISERVRLQAPKGIPARGFLRLRVTKL
jgi:uncharacterized delta-60 repeat protein